MVENKLPQAVPIKISILRNFSETINKIVRLVGEFKRFTEQFV